MLAFAGNCLAQGPLWAIGLTILAGMVVASAVGMFLRRRHDEAVGSGKRGDHGASQEGYLVSAVMGLLALLVGFTFSLAIDRYDTRRERVLTEANAIGTAYLRIQLLEEPHRSRMNGLLVDYTDNRVVLGTLSPSLQQTAALARSDALLTDLWTATVAAFPSIRHLQFSGSLIQAINDVIDADSARKTGRKAHVPQEVFLLLLTYQFIAAGVMGYVLVGRRGRQVGVFLFLLFGLSLVLIIDIDRPTTGGIVESQEPMLELQAGMRAQPPAVFDRFNDPKGRGEPVR